MGVLLAQDTAALFEELLLEWQGLVVAPPFRKLKRLLAAARSSIRFCSSAACSASAPCRSR
jgi:hypothetical protein